MHDPPRMRVREPLERLEHVVDDEPSGQRAPSVGDLAEVGAFEELHHDERQAVGARVDVDDARDVLGLQLRARSSLEQQARLRLAIGDVLVEELHGHVLVEKLVVRRDDDAHAALAEDPLHPVLAGEQISDLQQRGPPFGLARFHALGSGERGRHTH